MLRDNIEPFINYINNYNSYEVTSDEQKFQFLKYYIQINSVILGKFKDADILGKIQYNDGRFQVFYPTRVNVLNYRRRISKHSYEWATKSTFSNDEVSNSPISIDYLNDSIIIKFVDERILKVTENGEDQNGLCNKNNDQILNINFVKNISLNFPIMYNEMNTTFAKNKILIAEINYKRKRNFYISLIILIFALAVYIISRIFSDTSVFFIIMGSLVLGFGLAIGISGMVFSCILSKLEYDVAVNENIQYGKIKTELEQILEENPYININKLRASIDSKSENSDVQLSINDTKGELRNVKLLD